MRALSFNARPLQRPFDSSQLTHRPLLGVLQLCTCMCCSSRARTRRTPHAHAQTGRRATIRTTLRTCRYASARSATPSATPPAPSRRRGAAMWTISIGCSESWGELSQSRADARTQMPTRHSDSHCGSLRDCWSAQAELQCWANAGLYDRVYNLELKCSAHADAVCALTFAAGTKSTASTFMSTARSLLGLAPMPTPACPRSKSTGSRSSASAASES